MSGIIHLNGTSQTRMNDAADTVDPPMWPELPSEALQGLAGDIVRAATAESEADPAAVLATFLTFAGVVLGRGPWIKISDDYHHARLFSAIVGQSARGRKGTSEGPIRRIWDVAAETLGPLAWKPGPMSSGEGLINAIRDGDGTDADPGVADKRLLIVESEFAAPLRAMRREGNTLSAVLRMAWDGKTLEPITKSNPIVATKPHVGIVAHITEQELHTLLSSVEIFNGFANRFLWWCARRAKILPLARGLTDADAERLGQILAAQLATARKIERVEFSPEARRVYESIYADLTSDHGGLYGVVTSRAEVQVIRLALLYACLDVSSTIELRHLEAAVAVCDYCDASAKRLFGSIATDPLEGRVIEALQTGPKAMTELHRALGNHVDAAMLRATLANLQGQGRIESVKRQTAGRPATAWQLRDGFLPANEAKKAN
jgi:hypothetical protein